MTININVGDITSEFDIEDDRYLKQFKENYKQKNKNKNVDFAIRIKKRINKKIPSFQIFSPKFGIYNTEVKPFVDFRNLNFLLKGFIEFFTINKNVFLLHGSSFFINDKAFIFLGPSGAGKSTVVSFVKDTNILGEDTVILKKENKNYFVYPSPFDKKKASKIGDKKIKLAGIFLLRKWKTTLIKKVHNEKVKKSLIMSSFLYIFLKFMSKKTKLPVPKLSEKKLKDFYEDILQTTPLYYLYFEKNSRFVSFIKKLR